MTQTNLELVPPFNDFTSPFLVAGPCSAESETQVLETAYALKKMGNISLFRSGIWKPRTRPGSFEGIGKIGLGWLNRVQKEVGLPVAIEVACAEHVELALKAKMDVLWLGARTVVNPFLVQQIAEALRGVDIPIFVKNPINTDLSLWIGALERFNHVGIKKLVAVHRGFSTMEESKYRFPPHWKIPFELKRRFKDLPILCDPSHIAGKNSLVKEVAQMAMDLDFQGLMIETHPSPSNAFSDKEQQLTPKELEELINLLNYKNRCLLPPFEEEMSNLRKQIDRIDHQIIDHLFLRKKVVEELAKTKIKNNLSFLQIDRMKQMMQERMEKGMALGLQESFIEEIFSVIHEEAIRQQTSLNPHNLSSQEVEKTPSH